MMMSDHVEEIYDWLRSRWPEDLPGWLTLASGLGKGDFHIRGSFEINEKSLRDLADRANRYANRGDNVWCTVNAFGVAPRAKGRANQVRFVTGIVADIDQKSHPDPMAVIDALPPELQPSMTVWSGGGAQPIWMFEKPLDLDTLVETTGHELEHLQDSVQQLGLLLKAALEAQAGVTFDNVSNLDRVMRIPYTSNVKYDPPREVTIVRSDTGRRYTGRMLQQALLDVVGDAPVRPATAPTSSVTGEPGQLAPSADKIEQMIAAAPHVPNGQQRDYLLRLIGSMWAQGYAPSLIEREAMRVVTDLLVVYDPSYPWTSGDVAQMIADTARRFGQIDRFELTPEQAAWAQSQSLPVIPSSSNGHHSFEEERARRIEEAILGITDPKVRDLVARNVMTSMASEQARRIMSSARFEMPPGRTLAEMLAAGVPPIEWTVEGLHATGTNTTLTAQYKSGKTTMLLNLMKALVDQEDFLGMFPCSLHGGNVGFFNYELDDVTYLNWAARTQVAHSERIVYLDVRGRTIDLLDDHVAEEVATWLRRHEISFWIIDPFARAFHGDENSNSEVNRWCNRVDEIKRWAGVPDAFVTLHTGRAEFEEGAERARGATRLDDWTDARLILKVENGPEPRRRSIARRHVRQGHEIEPIALVFDEDRWGLTVETDEGGRAVEAREARIQDGVSYVREAAIALNAVSQDRAVTKTTLRDAINRGNGTKRQAWVDAAINQSVILTTPGQRGGLLCWLATEEERQEMAAALQAIAAMGDGDSSSATVAGAAATATSNATSNANVHGL